MMPVELSETEVLDELYSEQKLKKIFFYDSLSSRRCIVIYSKSRWVCNVYAEKWVKFYGLFRLT
jgi:hypothetical protein